MDRIYYGVEADCDVVFHERLIGGQWQLVSVWMVPGTEFEP